VDQHERRPAAGCAEEDAMAVQDDLAQGVVAGGAHGIACVVSMVAMVAPR
jgi:hypothetical protein